MSITRTVNLVQMFENGEHPENQCVQIQLADGDCYHHMSQKGHLWSNITIDEEQDIDSFIDEVVLKNIPGRGAVDALYYLHKNGKFKILENFDELPEDASNIYVLQFVESKIKEEEGRQRSRTPVGKGKTEDFLLQGRVMMEYIVDYLDNLADRPVIPKTTPGFMRSLIPEEPPAEQEPWEDIMNDVETKIMPGMVHWRHPGFFAYFPCAVAYPNILADMLCDALGVIGYSWAASPACTEMEAHVLDWFGKMMNLPSFFLTYEKNSKGGGMIQNSASNGVFACMLAARQDMIQKLKAQEEDLDEHEIFSRLVAYASVQAHSCVERAAMLCAVNFRAVETDENDCLRGEAFRKVLEEDIEDGLFPFFCCATLGTTGTTAFDKVDEIGPICKEHDMWLHIDAAYAGNAFICPEFRHLMNGVEYASSFVTDPYKLMLVSYRHACLWVRDRKKMVSTFKSDRDYLQDKASESKGSIEYRQMDITQNRKFNILKMWFVIRCYGVCGLQGYIRRLCRLAKIMEQKILADDRFELCNKVLVALVCFRLKGSDDLNKRFLKMINDTQRLHMIPTNSQGRYIIRMAICAEYIMDEQLESFWKIISACASKALLNQEIRNIRI